MKGKTEEPQTVRVVVKPSRHKGGHHGGAWKVAYSDFVTTMMALFIVLWIVSQNAATREAVAKYFKNPGIFRQGAAVSIVKAGAGILPGEHPPGGTAPDQSEAGSEEQALQAAATQIKGMLENSGLFETVRDQIKVEVTREGLRIELMERDHSLFFRVGSAVVVHPMKPILENLAKVLAPLPNQITVEGHTDSRQYSDWHNYSNWELSTDRANSARKILEASGLAPGRIDGVVGHADRLLLLPNEPLNASNRRITLIVRRHGHA